MLLVPFTINAVKQEALLAIFKLIDADCGGSISKLELIGAVYRVLAWEIRGEKVGHNLQSWRHGVESSLDDISAKCGCVQHVQRCEDSDVAALSEGSLALAESRPARFIKAF